MTPKPPLKNVGASVRARLTRRASERKENVQLALTRFAIERLLYRLSLSPHRDQFVLKGAMLFSLWAPTPYRATGRPCSCGWQDLRWDMERGRSVEMRRSARWSTKWCLSPATSAARSTPPYAPP